MYGTELFSSKRVNKPDFTNVASTKGSWPFSKATDRNSKYAKPSNAVDAPGFVHTYETVSDRVRGGDERFN